MGEGNCPLVDSLIGLELVIRRPPRARLNDATNLLGGVADVLQSDRRGVIDLTHLGDLAAVAIYRDDAQIREVIYREEPATESSFRVRVWRLATASDGD